VLEPEDTHQASILSNFGTLYFVEANILKPSHFFKCADDPEKMFGPENLDVATSLNNLASVYREEGSMQRLNPSTSAPWRSGRNCLHLRIRKWAVLLSDWANLYESGKYSKAEPSLRRAVAIQEKSLGAMHPEFAASLDSPACSTFGR